MTNQELYTKVRKHLLTQMQRAILGSVCRYRGLDGLKCAVGCLIPDSNYTPLLEGRLVDFPLENYRVARAAGLDPLKVDQMDLAVALQTIHDSHEPSEWARLLDKTAFDYGLKIEA